VTRRFAPWKRLTRRRTCRAAGPHPATSTRWPHPDGRWIASRAGHGRCACGRVPLSSLPRLSSPGLVRTLPNGPDGRWLVTGEDGDERLRVWEWATDPLRNGESGGLARPCRRGPAVSHGRGNEARPGVGRPATPNHADRYTIATRPLALLPRPTEAGPCLQPATAAGWARVERTLKPWGSVFLEARLH